MNEGDAVAVGTPMIGGTANVETLSPTLKGSLVTFIFLNLLLKFSLVKLNLAEYTDGILQLTVFENRAGLYPPLYGALARLLSLSGIDEVLAGRCVSSAAGALAVIPVYLMTRRLYGEGAARFAALLFTISPLVLRWSSRVMTDALFLMLSSLCLFLAWEAWNLTAKTTAGSLSDQDTKPESKNAVGNVGAGSRADRYLAGAFLMAVLAALTRYQGVFLLVPLVFPLRAMIRNRMTSPRGSVPWLTGLALLSWVTLPLWIWWDGFAHGGQMSDRASGYSIATLLDYWNTAESFVLISPYYLGYPVAAFALFGVAVSVPAAQTTLRSRFLILYGVWAVLLLGIHSAFQSFQYRYMMPVLPGVLVLAGAGMMRLEGIGKARISRAFASGLIIVSISYLTLFSCALLVLQRQTFGDQKQAAEILQRWKQGAVYSNEHYGTFWKLGCVKMRFWTGRPVEFLYERPSVFSPGLKLRSMEPGSLIAISTAYGGDEAVLSLIAELKSRYRLRPLTDQPLTSNIVALHDDVMTLPLFNQNPAGWVMRYKPQTFRTYVVVVEGMVQGTGS